jgi:hypothetical protein
MYAQASQYFKVGQMLVIVLINNSTLDANRLASAKLEMVCAEEVNALEQNSTVSWSLCNQSQRCLETMKPFIVKIRRVSKFLEKFVNYVRSLAYHSSLPSSTRGVVVRI